MKIGKKAAMAGGLCIGVLMLATTAFADIATKSGYDQLKDAVKSTAAFMSGANANYTQDTTYIVKVDGNTVSTMTSTEKRDYPSGTAETVQTSEGQGLAGSESYSYSDRKQNIYKVGNDDKYYVTEYASPRVRQTGNNNPFDKGGAKDLERLVDACVGNLSDYVAVEEKQDGTRELSGSVNQSQIPALPNVLVSYLYKQRFVDTRTAVNDVKGSGTQDEVQNELNKVSEDIFVKEVSGKAEVGSNGCIQSILAGGKLTGRDRAGNTHEIEVEVLVKLKDVGTTVIQAPDLTGKKVEKQMDRSGSNLITQKYVGIYKADMVIAKDDKFVKIGERTVEITQIDDKYVAGKYSETVLPEYKDYQGKLTEVALNAEIKDGNSAEYTYKDADENEKTGHIYFTGTGTIQLDLPEIYMESVPMDGAFSRVFSN